MSPDDELNVTALAARLGAVERERDALRAKLAAAEPLAALLLRVRETKRALDEAEATRHTLAMRDDCDGPEYEHALARWREADFAHGAARRAVFIP